MRSLVRGGRRIAEGWRLTTPIEAPGSDLLPWQPGWSVGRCTSSAPGGAPASSSPALSMITKEKHSYRVFFLRDHGKHRARGGPRRAQPPQLSRQPHGARHALTARPAAGESGGRWPGPGRRRSRRAGGGARMVELVRRAQRATGARGEILAGVPEDCRRNLPQAPRHHVREKEK